MAERKFGILTTVTGTTEVVINSIKRDKGIEKAEARDATGKVTDVFVYSENESITIDGLLNLESAVTKESIEAGTTITVGTDSYLIDTVSVSESNTAVATISITASKADSATYHVLA